jgi:superfamily I DNA/RNA helicase
MQGSDPGFFVLATHSFIEAFLRERFDPPTRDDDGFAWFIDAFRAWLVRNADRFLPELSALLDLKMQHQVTNVVRHRFGAFDADEARCAVQHLRRFCALVGVQDLPNLAKLEESLKAWDDRRSAIDMMRELTERGFKLLMLGRENKTLMERVQQLESAQAQLVHVEEQKANIERQLHEIEHGADRKTARVDELRQEINNQKMRFLDEESRLRARIRELEPAQEYLDALARVTVYTRTRFDYERSITRLTREQQKVLDQISFGADFLVKGAAGTGKTLILIKAIEKARGSGPESLGLDLNTSVALLTFTKSLVKYDRYVADLTSGSNPADVVSTAEAFIRERLDAVSPGLHIDYNVVNSLSGKHSVAGVTERELAAEAETLIWGNDVGADEYLSGDFDRRGMRKPLGREQRAAVWNAVQSMAAEMESSRVFSKNYSRMKLAHYAQANPNDLRLRMVDFIFIDEAQDLSAVELKAIKACSRKCVILAGDADQSIYQPAFTFRRAGIDIQGRTRILKTNFRNTVQLQEVAERFRTTMPSKDDESQPEAFRLGPPPELYTGADRRELQELLLKRLSIFLKHLNYDPENIGILVPLNDDIEPIAEALDAAGYKAADIKSTDFDFAQRGVVRLSTMHSSKGLDFPVVLLFLHRLPAIIGAYDEEAIDRMSRNLIYVSITRAMDHLNVFCPRSSPSRAITDLVEIFARENGDTREGAGSQ